MKRSLTTIALMGIIATVLLAFAGSVFVGKVGGAENVSALEEDLRVAFGSVMEDPNELSVKITPWREELGLLVTYPPSTRSCRDDRILTRHMDGMGAWILSRKEWRRDSSFVLIRLELAGGRVLEKRYPR